MKTIHDILQLGLNRNLSEEKILSEYFNKIGGSRGLIYVGANTGQEIPFLKNHANKIYAFEPVGFDSVWQELLKHKDDKVECINVALSDSEQIAVDFYPASNNFESSSLLRPNESLNNEYSWLTFSDPIKVNTKRLDSYKFYNNCDVLIMDVQGSELDVLNGISNFANLKIIVLEYCSYLYENSCTFYDLNEKLSKEGFKYQETYGLYYNELTNYYAGNAIFIKEDLINNKPWQENALNFSQLGQDYWVLSKTNNKNKGYFVEFGASDGVKLSNTYVLEKYFDWDGILCEPNPTHYESLLKNRNCTVSAKCVYHESEKFLPFLCVNGPLTNLLSSLKQYSNGDHHAEARKDCNEILVETITLNELLENNNAPSKIDYLSVDTEGGEYEILNSLNWEKYEISLITVEHNFTSQREKIYNLLTSMGYERVEYDENRYEDWYSRI
jgi:FkbM family methyltransferase